MQRAAGLRSPQPRDYWAGPRLGRPFRPANRSAAAPRERVNRSCRAPKGMPMPPVDSLPYNIPRSGPVKSSTSTFFAGATRTGRRPRASSAITMMVALDPDGSEPLYRQLYRGVRAAILGGRLPPGGRVPSTRAIAEDLGI